MFQKTNLLSVESMDNFLCVGIYHSSLNYKKIFLFNCFTLNDLLKNSTHQERMVEKDGARGWGVGRFRDLGNSHKIKQKNVNL